MPNNPIKPKLILREKELKKIPCSTFEQKNLLKVKLMKNKIKTIPKDIECLSRLETLDLSNNEIIHTYTKVFELRKLKILNLNNNRIINLPRQIGNLQKLQKLQLANNTLKKLPDEIETLTNLKELNISYNKFKQFPEQIFRLKSLKSLWVGGNFFEIFPIAKILDELPNLVRVYTYSNIDMSDKFDIDVNYKRLSGLKGNNYTILKHKPDSFLIDQTKEIFKKLTSYIVKDDMVNFFKLLNNNQNIFEQNNLVLLINLQSQWNTISKESHSNIISKDQEILQKNKIRNGILQILLKP